MFFEEPYLSLPKDAQYYFNVLIICIALAPDYAEELFGNNSIVDLWDIQRVNDARPVAIHTYVSRNLNKDFDYEIECFPHQVVEVTDNVAFYDMIDYDTDDPWRLDPDAIY